MELDGKTRVFLTNNKGMVREVFPEEKPEGKELNYEESRQVYKRADFLCYNHIRVQTETHGGADIVLEKHWSVDTGKFGNSFNIDSLGVPPDEEFQRLAEDIEILENKKGFTIVARL